MLPPLDHDEARRELTGLLDGSIGTVPLAPLVEHLMSVYAAAGWPVLRDAGLALRRRADSVELEQLEVEDVEDSSTLAKRHFGFTEAMSADSKHSAGAA